MHQALQKKSTSASPAKTPGARERNTETASPMFDPAPKASAAAAGASSPSAPRKGACACGGGCPRCAAGKRAFAAVTPAAVSGNVSARATPMRSPPMHPPRKPIQAKLRIGDRDEPLEREADEAAEQVLAMPVASRRAVPPRLTPLATHAAQTRRADAGGGIGEVSADAQSRIDALRGGGVPLSAAARAYFEPRFDRDLSAVRLHTGAAAAQTARELSARAFTVGNDIVFAEHQYLPGSDSGNRLLAHELAHTVQQGATSNRRVQRIPADLDIKSIARTIFKAIDGPGTDEEAVYGALQQLERDPGAIDLLKQTYLDEYKLDLIADINDDFSEEELEYALQLLNIGHLDSDQRIEREPNAVVSIATAIERIWAATDRVGTDEEAIFATLLPFDKNTAELEDAFEKRYNESLRAVLLSELSGSELDYAMSLMAPEGERRSMADKLSPTLIDSNFPPEEREMAGKILRDLMAVRGDRLDFANPQELVDEIHKRLRTSKLMRDSQTGNAFGYPESLPPDCPGYTSDIFQQASVHARVNKDAKDYWQPRVLDREYFYYFRLSPLGKNNATEAIKRLFTDQSSFCDRTLIHCDYLINVIHFRAYAESLGAPVFDELVRTGKIDPVLTFTGFPKPPEHFGKSPMAWSLQYMRPASEDDLVIGDHVIFWNHLAYDAITMASPGPWRLENALLVDKNSAGKDLYEGHGAPEISPNVIGPGPRDLMLHDLMKVYNANVEPAIDLAREVDADPSKQTELNQKFPRVAKDGSEWVILEREDREENRKRKRRTYPLRKLSGIDDPDLIGLRDPDDPSKMGQVKRPVESAKGPKPSP